MNAENWLTEIGHQYTNFEETYFKITLNSTVTISNGLEYLNQDNGLDNPRIPIPKPIECHKEENSDNKYYHTIILPKESARQLYELQTDTAEFSLNYFNFCNDPDEPKRIINKFVDDDEYSSPYDMDEFKKYVNWISYVYSFFDTLHPKNIINHCKYLMNRISYNDAFKTTYKQKCLIFEYVIHPALINCKKLKKIVDDRSPCSLKMHDYNSSKISEITKIEDKNTHYIYKFVNDLHQIIHDTNMESIEIYRLVKDKILSFFNQVNQKEILRNLENQFNIMELNETSFDHINNTLANVEDDESGIFTEQILIKKALRLSACIYKVSLLGIGNYSNQIVSICGVKIKANTSNSSMQKFTFVIDKIPEITYKFCYEILNILGKTEFIDEIKCLENDKPRNPIELIRSVNEKVIMIVREYHSILENNENENKNYRAVFTQRMCSIPQQYQSELSGLLSAIAGTIQITELMVFYFGDIISQIKANTSKIDELIKKRALITWMQKVITLNENIIAIEVEMKNNDIKITEIKASLE